MKPLIIAFIGVIILPIVIARLVQVQVFFRHGERVPTSIITFPKDSPAAIAASKSLPYDAGEMTNRGMNQEYLLGSKLRQLYGDFFVDRYRSLEVKVNSGKDNRTIASALIAMASFFPPKGIQIWNDKLLWYPVPVFSNEIFDHVSFALFDHCPSLKQNMLATRGYDNLTNFYKQAMQKLELDTGLKIPDLYIFQKVLDIFVSRKHLKELIPLPDWADNDKYMQWITELQFGVHSRFIDLYLDTLGGWHYDQVLSRMDEFINNRTKQKLIFYSAHDTNLLTLGRFLGISPLDKIMPSYGSFLAFELHEDQPGSFNVKLTFLPFFNGTTEVLKFKNCPEPCGIDFFKTFTPRTTTEQWMSECKGQTSCSSDVPFYVLLGGILVVLLVVSAFVLNYICKNYIYKRRYELLADK